MRIRLFAAAVVAVALTIASVAEASLQLTANFEEGHSAVSGGDANSSNNVDVASDNWSLVMSGSSPWQAGVQINSVTIGLDTGVFFDDDDTDADGVPGSWDNGFPFATVGGSANLLSSVVDAAKKTLTLTFSSFDYDDNFLFSIDVDNSNAVVRGAYGGTDGHDMRGATVTVNYFNGSADTTTSFTFDTPIPSPSTASGSTAIQAVPEPMTFAVWSGLALAGLAIGWQRQRARA
jgi:hypothetical protein